MSRAYLLYGFWIPCRLEDPAPRGVDSAVWHNSSPARALENALSAVNPFHNWRAIEAWEDCKLSRVYFGWRLRTFEGPTHFGQEIPKAGIPDSLQGFFEMFEGQELGWHLFSSDQEDP